jgi:hypothetical protein
MSNLHDEKAEKGAGKVHPITGHEAPKGEYRYSSTLSLTSALDEVVNATSRPLVSGTEIRNPMCRRLDWLQGRAGCVLHTSPSPEFDPHTVQPVPTTLFRPTEEKVRCL